MQPRPFSYSTVKLAFGRCGGRCECIDPTHRHKDRCSQVLNWNNPGRVGFGAWETHHIDPRGDNMIDNCQILCWNCYKQTLSESKVKV